MSTQPFRRAAVSRRNVIAGLVALVSVPAFGKDTGAKAFLDDIYRHYVGNSKSDAKGVVLGNAKAVRGYFTVGLSSLIMEDRTAETKHGEPAALDSDPFVGRSEWDISDLAVDVDGTGLFRATGTVTFTNEGRPEKIVLELQRSGTDWRIADIEWPTGSLRSVFRRRAAYDGEALPR